MNDQIIMENYLLVLKSTMEVYVHGTLESANKLVCELLHHGIDETLKCQEKVFHQMNLCGWYNVTNVKNDVIEKTINNLQKD